jgi:hypothetical protein
MLTTNDTPRYYTRFVAELDAPMISCYGANHSDVGHRGTCRTCLATIVKVEHDGTKGTRYYDIRSRYNAADRHVEDFACFQGAHRCNAEIAAKVEIERQAAIAKGELVIGQHVTVVKGRKVPKGTAGEIFWEGMNADFHGTLFLKLGIRDAEGTTHWVRADYCKATSTLPQPAAADAEIVADEPKTTTPSAPRSTGSHAACDHPATKSARAACRKARNA